MLTRSELNDIRALAETTLFKSAISLSHYQVEGLIDAWDRLSVMTDIANGRTPLWKVAPRRLPMSPDTPSTPTKAAVKAARDVADALYPRFVATGCDHTLIYDLGIHAIAAALEAYAAEHTPRHAACPECGDSVSEHHAALVGARLARAAALAKLADAESKTSACIDHCTEFEMRAVYAEERVRELEAALRAVQQGCSGEPYCLIEGHRIARAALAAQPASKEHGRGE